ncbi:MAG: class 1 isoprenoid biosynthesis enzyme [Desulfosalsimonadaceae bacterium]
MDIIDIFKNMCGSNSKDPYCLLASDLQEGLGLYWQTAGTILEGSGISLSGISGEFLSLPFNFFSALFLYSYFRAGIPKDRRVLYAAVNQCLRGMVTGCDNILDNEYKKTLATDLPEESHKFRSIIDIMVSDRILFNLLTDYCVKHDRSLDVAKKGSAASLTALSRSGVQEASEEGGISMRLPPDDVISKIHHYKTGILFECIWAVPAVMESELSPTAAGLKQGLHDIGIGCQILDDMVDLVKDIEDRRHNYIASVVHHGENARARNRLLEKSSFDSPGAFFSEFPQVLSDAHAKAMAFLDSGLERLFREDHLYMKKPAAAFFAKRIGVANLFNQLGRALP